jgi:uncharacterized protein
MSNTSAIATNKYVSLTTYTKSGQPKPLPVWIVELADGRVGFTTSGVSWKAKRIRNDPKVTLRPCDQRGKVADDAVEVAGQASVVQGAEFVEVQSLVKKKYGAWVTVINLMNSIRGVFKKEATGSDCAVVIALD